MFLNCLDYVFTFVRITCIQFHSIINGALILLPLAFHEQYLHSSYYFPSVKSSCVWSVGREFLRSSNTISNQYFSFFNSYSYQLRSIVFNVTSYDFGCICNLWHLLLKQLWLNQLLLAVALMKMLQTFLRNCCEQVGCIQWAHVYRDPRTC